jgi:hypothetical protein
MGDYGVLMRNINKILVRKREIFSSPTRPERLWGQPSLLSTLGVKQPGREADHSPTSSAEVKE